MVALKDDAATLIERGTALFIKHTFTLGQRIKKIAMTLERKWVR